jgi:hypothetical protein
MLYPKQNVKDLNVYSIFLMPNGLSRTHKLSINKQIVYRVYQKKRNLGISQEIDIVLKTKDFRRLGI